MLGLVKIDILILKKKSIFENWDLAILHTHPAKYPSCCNVSLLRSRYSTDVIGACAFGLQLGSLSAGESGMESEFRKYGKTIFDASPRYLIKEVMIMIWPPLAKFFHLTDFPVSATDYFRSALHQTIEYREKNNVHRNDLVQSLIQARRDLVLNENLSPEGKFYDCFAKIVSKIIVSPPPHTLKKKKKNVPTKKID